MRRLAAADLIRVWELGQGRPNWLRALLLLGPYFPDRKPSQLSALSVGERNAHLFALRESLSGGVINGFVRCPVCREALEFSETVSAILENYQPPASREGRIEAAGCTIRYRLLDSRDLAAASERHGVEQARGELIRRSVIDSHHGETALPAAEIPADAVGALADAVAHADPLSETRIALACAECGHVWKAGLDIVTILWAEIEVRAKRLLHDVQLIAREYGWSERDILAMSEGRRQYYLGVLQ